MERYDTYELVFTKSDEADRENGGDRATEDVVVVRRTDARGPGGHPIYTDDTGILRAEISDRAEVRMLASGGHQSYATPVRARPVTR
ncbi:DUF6296 family protein [Streptomyces sp. LX-29]|uniref:DUF6296 family protein n=1 Tax=Streptomyces sp. LX-29 TaxID=2900152 RepID=UPI00240E76D9|nr:DUF6296 family protein [Streptomyces sp. LX-29]WFB11150.1 DUF6296 family protein [Streptomyces sp. LX-29]